jgi:hypothetical protein
LPIFIDTGFGGGTSAVAVVPVVGAVPVSLPDVVEVDDAFACDEPLLDLSVLPTDVEAVVFFTDPALADLPDVVDGPDFGAWV